jgi:hypothetical protein
MDHHKYLPDELVPGRRNDAPAVPAQTGRRRSAKPDRPADRSESDLPAALTLRTSTTP